MGEALCDESELCFMSDFFGLHSYNVDIALGVCVWSSRNEVDYTRLALFLG